MRRMMAVPSLVLAVTLAGTTGCLDGSGPNAGTPPTLPGLVVSAPVQSSAVQGSVQASAAASVSAGVAYVSLVPGSVPDGRQATIQNLATGQTVAALVMDGGFDPIPIAASVGDTLAIEITRSGSVGPLRAVELVRPVRPPVVVRTSPPKGGHDVPLNAAIVVVFSDPIDPATLTTQSVQVWCDTTPVTGTVRIADSVGLRAEFHPDLLLAGQTDYRFVVTQAIRDVNGLALDSALEVPFTTGPSVQLAAKLVFTVQPSNATAGAVLSPAVVVTIEDSAGNAVTGATGTVTAALGANPGSYLGGTATVAAVNGVAVFRDLWVQKAATGYSLTVASGTLAGATSAAFDVVPATPPTGLVFASVSAGGDYTCGLTTGGSAYCWGNGDAGTLGTAEPGPDQCPSASSCSTWPAAVSAGLTFTSLSAGALRACGVTTTGSAYCWGDGVLGADYACPVHESTWGCATPMRVAGGLTFKVVSVGYYHTCGVTTDGAAYCWGTYVALGNGQFSGSTPVAVSGGLTFATVSAGVFFTCGLTPDGTAYCWGFNGAGELGTGSTAGPDKCGDMGSCSLVPVRVAGGLSFTQLVTGAALACGLTEAGTAYCWGNNSAGVLGTGLTTDPLPTPTPVAGGLAFAALTAGPMHVCGVTGLGVAYCWGKADEGGLGNGTGTPVIATTPVAVSGGLSFAMLSAGGTYDGHSCGVTTDGAAYCWGRNFEGQLGNGMTTASGVPVKVAGQP